MIVSVKDYVGAVRAEKEKTMELLISGYGPAGRKNLVKCDETGKVVWADTVESPSFICTAGDLLFAGTENDDYAVFTAYVRDGDGYRMTDSLRFDGVGCLCHICYSEKHAMLFGACWGSGHLLYASLDKDGKFYGAGKLLQVNETGDDSLITRAHFVHVNHAEDTLMVNNVGLDIIYFYEIADGTVREKDRIYTERGQHPRHSVYNRDESLLYVVTELSNEVLVYAMPEKKLLQRISTLPEGFVGKSHCSAICLSPNEKTLYVANRYSESLVYFRIGADGIAGACRGGETAPYDTDERRPCACRLLSGDRWGLYQAARRGWFADSWRGNAFSVCRGCLRCTSRLRKQRFAQNSTRHLPFRLYCAIISH